MKLYDELVWRGLIENITDESLIENFFNGYKIKKRWT